MIIGSNVTVGWQLVPQGNSVCLGTFSKMSRSHCRRFHPAYFATLLQFPSRSRAFEKERKWLLCRLILPWSQRLSFILYWPILQREPLLTLFFLGSKRWELGALISASHHKFPNEKRLHWNKASGTRVKEFTLCSISHRLVELHTTLNIFCIRGNALMSLVAISPSKLINLVWIMFCLNFGIIDSLVAASITVFCKQLEMSPMSIVLVKFRVWISGSKGRLLGW